MGAKKRKNGLRNLESGVLYRWERSTTVGRHRLLQKFGFGVRKPRGGTEAEGVQGFQGGPGVPGFLGENLPPQKTCVEKLLLNAWASVFPWFVLFSLLYPEVPFFTKVSVGHFSFSKIFLLGSVGNPAEFWCGPNFWGNTFPPKNLL